MMPLASQSDTNKTMKKSNINFSVELDENNIPEKIQWDATDKGSPGMDETKAISLSLWDPAQKNTMRIDLWTKEMPVEEMKRFHVDCLGGLAQNILNSTGDEFMATQTSALAEKLVEYLKKQP